MGNKYMAIDIGEKEGKLTLGYLLEGKLQLEKVHQFDLSQKEIDGVLKKDIDSILKEIKAGLIHCKEINKLPVLVGVNEWDSEIIYKLCYLSTLFPVVTKPGSVIGSLALEVTEEVGYDCIVVIPATSDIASRMEQTLKGEEKDAELSTISSILFLMLFSHELPNLQAAQELLG